MRERLAGTTAIVRRLSCRPATRQSSELPLAVAPLSFGVFAGSAEGSLVADTGAAHRFAARQLRALPGTVEISAIALCADAHLHPAAAAVIKPVGRRLLEQPQTMLAGSTGQHREGEA